MGKRLGITDNHQFHAGAGHRHIHPSQLLQEANLAPFVGTHQTDHHHIPFLPLEAIHGVDGNQLTEGLEELGFLDEVTQEIDLRLIG